MIKSLLREPLLHFLLLGSLLFAAWAVRSPDAPPAAPAKPAIVVSEARIDSLIDNFTKARQRPPAPQELRGLIDDYLQEEVFYREALALKLDEDDTIVRRRLRQKMELFVEDITSAAQPTEVQLQEFLAAHGDQFRVDRKVALRQVYLNPDKHADSFDQDLAELKSQLDENSNPDEHGDAFLLPSTFELTPVRQLTQLFGGDFGTEAFALPAGTWAGPVTSGYGVHLIFVVDKEEGRLPPLAEIRSSVELEWSARRRAEAKREFFEKLLDRYQVTIETPSAAPAGQEPAP